MYFGKNKRLVFDLYVHPYIQTHTQRRKFRRLTRGISLRVKQADAFPPCPCLFEGQEKQSGIWHLTEWWRSWQTQLSHHTHNSSYQLRLTYPSFNVAGKSAQIRAGFHFSFFFLPLCFHFTFIQTLMSWFWESSTITSLMIVWDNPSDCSHLSFSIV